MTLISIAPSLLPLQEGLVTESTIIAIAEGSVMLKVSTFEQARESVTVMV